MSEGQNIPKSDMVEVDADVYTNDAESCTRPDADESVRCRPKKAAQNQENQLPTTLEMIQSKTSQMSESRKHTKIQQLCEVR